MNKKKFLALLLTGAMALAALTGCGSKEETPAEGSGEEAPAEGGAYKIALIQQHQTNCPPNCVSAAGREPSPVKE